MVKTLVTIGYHYAELDWGSDVRSYYQSNNFKQNRDITFYTIQNSTVRGGDFCVESEKEVEKVVKKHNFETMIDIHSLRKQPKTKIAYVAYIGDKVNLVKKLEQEVVKFNLGYSFEYIGDTYANLADFIADEMGGKFCDIPETTIETSLNPKDVRTKNSTYQKALRDTCRLINLIYEFHANPMNTH